MTDTLTTSLFVRELGLTLLHFLWQGLVIALVTALALTMLRRRTAAVRYSAACAGLALMLAAPVLTWQWQASTATPSPAAGTALVIGSVRSAGSTIPHANPIEAWSAADFESLAPLAVVVWLTGVFVLSVRLVRVSLAVGVLRRRTVGPLSSVWQARIQDVADRLRLRRVWRAAESSVLDVPTVVGWMRPLILVPTSTLAGLAPSDLEAILAHELAHIRRHDYVVNLTQRVVETLLFYHPAVWWVSHQITLERELCCDDLAVEVCGDRVAYARALASLEELRPALPALALTATGGSLLARIRRLLGAPPDADRSPALTGAAIIFTLGVLFVIGNRPIGAQAPASNAQVHEDIRLAATLLVAPFREEASNLVYLRDQGSSATSAQQPRTQVPPPPPPPPPPSQGETRVPPPPPPPATPQVSVSEHVSVSAARPGSAPATAQADAGTQFAGAARPGAGIANPVPIRKPSPLYTPEAMRMNVQGAVDLEAVIRKDGTVGDVRIIKSLDNQYGMDQEVIKAAKQWMFTPARDRDGNPVDIVVVIGFDLRLHGLTVTGPAGAAVTMPMKTRATRPIYPDAARSAGTEGTVVVEAFTNAQGEVVYARIKQSVPGLDEAALAAARAWQYTPTLLDGVPTETLVTATIDFTLNPFRF